MPLQYQLLQLLVNPTVAYLLLLRRPGRDRDRDPQPGADHPRHVGVVSLLLGAYGTAQLPVTAVGIALLVIGARADHRRGPPADARDPRASWGWSRSPSAGLAAVRHRLEHVRGLGAGRDRRRGPARRRRSRSRSRRRSQAARARSQTGLRATWSAQTGDVRVPLDPVGQVFVDGALWRAKLADERSDAEADRAPRARR